MVKDIELKNRKDFINHLMSDPVMIRYTPQIPQKDVQKDGSVLKVMGYKRAAGSTLEEVPPYPDTRHVSHDYTQDRAYLSDFNLKSTKVSHNHLQVITSGQSPALKHPSAMMLPKIQR